MKASTAYTLIGMYCTACLSFCHADDLFDRSVVEIIATVQNIDPIMPWRREAPGVQTGFGVVVAPGRVITTEDLIRNATMVELRRPRTGTKILSHIILADHQAGLALLSCPPGSNDIAQLPLATSVPTNTSLSVVQFDANAAIQSDQGRLIEYAVGLLPESPSPTLMFKVLANLNTGERGAPVFNGGELAGLVIRADRSSQTFLALPYTAIRRFLQQAAEPKYTGIASAGFGWKALTDPVRRNFYAITNYEGGIEVTRTFPNTGAFEVLMPGDVIMRWDGQTIDSQGYYNDTEFGRLILPHLISGRRRPGDTVRIDLIRQGRARTVTIKLTRHADDDSLIPDNILRSQPEYIVECGMIFRELGGDYLRAFGNKWILQANPRLIHLYLNQTQNPQNAGHRYVILVGVLPDEINIGYQHLRDMVVTAVNHKPIDNLGDIARIMATDGGISHLSLQGFGQDIVLDIPQRTDANRRIARSYRIPSLQYLRAAQSIQ